MPLTLSTVGNPRHRLEDSSAGFSNRSSYQHFPLPRVWSVKSLLVVYLRYSHTHHSSGKQMVELIPFSGYCGRTVEHLVLVLTLGGTVTHLLIGQSEHTEQTPHISSRHVR